MLRAWIAGERSAQDLLFERLYADLHRLARGASQGKHPKDTISATGLVAEAFLRLEGAERLNITDRKHFFAITSRAMRRIVIDRARALRASKAGGEIEHVTVEDGMMASLERSPEDLLAIDQALEQLAVVKERLVLVAELLIFGGLGLKEVASSLGVSRRTVQRDIDEIGDELKRLGYVSGTRA